MAFLEVRDLRTYFFTRRGVLKAVDGVSFSLSEGETLGLVGESGCGKSVTCLSLLQLLPKPAGRIVGGEIFLDGEDLLKKSENEMRKIRGKKISIILQDPMTSLNPVLSIGNQVNEPIRLHQGLRGSKLRDRTKKIIQMVRIPSPEEQLRAFPHQLSGGMRQRVAGAIALSCQPVVLIADEPTTSLDVTIQAQYLALIKELQREAHFSVIFVTHDFGIVARICDRVAVMYAGKVVESCETREIFENPAHPYTMALIRSVPKVEKKVGRLFSIEGQPPPLDNLPPGCSFAPRCTFRNEKCNDPPPTVSIRDKHWASCWLYTH